jgi:hypothetical protein
MDDRYEADDLGLVAHVAGWRERTKAVAASFVAHGTAAGMRAMPAVPVTSRVDPTVRFVGSTISVLKPELAALPERGLCLAQTALRTQNLARLTDDPEPLTWSSTFVALGTLARASQLTTTAAVARSWLVDVVGMPAARLVVRAASYDRDLIAGMRAAGWDQFELDGCAPLHFRHRFGIPDTGGRNVNIAVCAMDGGLDDIGNVIVLERGGSRIAVEFAMGVSALLARGCGLAHPLQASPVADVWPTGTDQERRVADALSVVALLASERVRPVNRGRGGILLRYMKTLVALLPPEVDLASISRAAAELAGPDTIAAPLIDRLTTLARSPQRETAPRLSE